MSTSFSRLAAFPRHRLLEAELMHGRSRELDLLARLGEPTMSTSADELHPVFFWDVEWACGLVMDLQFRQLSEELIVRLDQLDQEHALRHLDIEVRDLVVLDASPAVESGPVATAPDRRWEIWQGVAVADRRRVAAHLTERDAQCWCRELTAADPAETFWVTTDH